MKYFCNAVVTFFRCGIPYNKDRIQKELKFLKSIKMGNPRLFTCRFRGHKTTKHTVVQILLDPSQFIFDMLGKSLLDGLPQGQIDYSLVLFGDAIPRGESHSTQGTCQVGVGHSALEAEGTKAVLARQADRFDEDAAAYRTEHVG